MRKTASRLSFGLVLALAVLPTAAGADTTTIGSNLSAAASSNLCGAATPCTYVQTSGGSPTAVSPFNGQVTTWRLKMGSFNHAVRLRVLRPSGSGFTAIASSATETTSVTGSGINTFSTSLPIQVGDTIGLDNDTSSLYFATVPGATISFITPFLADGSTATPATQANLELLLNADITGTVPAPGSSPGTSPNAPSISSLKVKPKSFRAAKSGAGVAKKKKRTGATVSYQLSAAATVTFSVEKKQKGRKKSGKCIKAKKGSKGKRCSRYTLVGNAFNVSGTSGDNSFKFTGRVDNKKLAKGNYRLNATPSSSEGTGSTETAAFKIKR